MERNILKTPDPSRPRSSRAVRKGVEFSTGAKRNEERDDRQKRLAKAAVVAIIAWASFGLVDWFVVTFVNPGRLWFYFAARAVGLVILLAAYLWIRTRKNLSISSMRFVDTAVATSLATLITVTCIENGGLASPLAAGVVLVLLCRTYIASDHWRRSIVPVGLVVLSYPLTLLAMAAFSPYIAGQFGDSRAVASFFLNLMFVTSAGLISMAGGHMLWGLKRQLYNSRALGRYKLKRRIGEGGMGQIWLARHQAMRRDVAVKILIPKNSDDKRAIARFEREVRATSELVHPNTVRVFDYGVTSDGLWYYAMELLEGSDLHDEVKLNGPMEAKRAVSLLAQAARALSEAHGRGIVHRDIKPENLFLTALSGEGEFIKVLDFGLAKQLVSDAEPQASLTQAGWAVGTPQWVSPEVVQGDDADARSDIYGLGAVLYFLLCGRSPFGNLDMARVIQAHQNAVPKPPSLHLGRPIPKAVEDLVMKCLAKKPQERFSDSQKLALALEKLALSLPAGSSEPKAGAESSTAVTEVLEPSTAKTTIVDTKAQTNPAASV